jgi:hypothetical protein
MSARCAVCGAQVAQPKRAGRPRRYCSGKCRTAGHRARCNEIPASSEPDNVTAPASRPPARTLRWYERPNRRPKCRWCEMAIKPGEAAEAGYHAECKRYVEKTAAGSAPAAESMEHHNS